MHIVPANFRVGSVVLGTAGAPSPHGVGNHTCSSQTEPKGKPARCASVSPGHARGGWGVVLAAFVTCSFVFGRLLAKLGSKASPARRKSAIIIRHRPMKMSHRIFIPARRSSFLRKKDVVSGPQFGSPCVATRACTRRATAKFVSAHRTTIVHHECSHTQTHTRARTHVHATARTV